MIYFSIKQRFIPYTALLLLLLALLTISLNITNTIALPTTSVYPAGRYGQAMIFDSAKSRTIMYGGVIRSEGMSVWHSNETWSYDDLDRKWILLSPSSNPGLIAHHGMAYDPLNKLIICFGGLTETGSTTNNTWIFNCTTDQWIQVFPESAPPSRSDPALYYDEVEQRIVLFGGADFSTPSSTYFNDFWVYNPTDNTWTEISVSNRPSARYGHRIVYNSLSDQAFLFGGRSSSGTNAELWIYTSIDQTWILLETTNSPPTHYWHSMIYNLQENEIIVFGGRLTESIFTTLLNETWIFSCSINTWDSLEVNEAPPATVYPSSTFDSSTNRVILFGGTTSIVPLVITNETWAFDTTNEKWMMIEISSNSTSFSFMGSVIACTILLKLNKWRKKEKL